MGITVMPTTDRPPVGHRRRLRVLSALMATAIAISVVHYADNYLNYAAFPTSERVPAPSKALVGLSWFAFTAAGVAGYLLFRSGRRMGLACALLAYYSVSGLIGIGHYTAGEMIDAPWWRQGHVIADILCGVAIAGFAYSAWRSAQLSARAAAGPPRPGSSAHRRAGGG